jgi:anti-repressor protein
MNSVIPIIPFHGQDGIKAVSARALYVFLTSEENCHNFARWAEKFITTNEWAILGEDWVNATLGVNPQGGRPAQDFHLRLDFAKHIAMQARSERGQEVRAYFIAIEKRAREIPFEIPKTLSAALLLASQQAAQIEAQAPLVAYAEKVQASPTSFTVDTTAKELGLPVVKFREFVQSKYLFRRGRDWLPRAEYAGRGWFEVRTRTYDHNGVEITYHTTVITGEGRIRIRDAWDRWQALAVALA